MVFNSYLVHVTTSYFTWDPTFCHCFSQRITLKIMILIFFFMFRSLCWRPSLWCFGDRQWVPKWCLLWRVIYTKIQFGRSMMLFFGPSYHGIIANNAKYQLNIVLDSHHAPNINIIDHLHCTKRLQSVPIIYTLCNVCLMTLLQTCPVVQLLE